MTKKINLIFDLDETLVQLGEANHNNKGIQLKENKFLFIRPYCKELLNFCFKKFRVSFWTSGSPRYCKKILTIILSPEQLKKTKIIICKYENKFFTDHHPTELGHRLWSEELAKDLDYIKNE